MVQLIMATYHGIIEVRCLACDFVTKDDSTMEWLNDACLPCGECGKQFFLWVNKDGSRCVTLEGEDQEVQRLEYKG